MTKPLVTRAEAEERAARMFLAQPRDEAVLILRQQTLALSEVPLPELGERAESLAQQARAAIATDREDLETFAGELASVALAILGRHIARECVQALEQELGGFHDESRAEVS